MKILLMMVVMQLQNQQPQRGMGAEEWNGCLSLVFEYFDEKELIMIVQELGDWSGQRGLGRRLRGNRGNRGRTKQDPHGTVNTGDFDTLFEA